MKLLLAGDYCDHGRTSEIIKDGAYHVLFSQIREINKSVDVAIVNFEFPIQKFESTPISKCGPALSGQEDSVRAIKYAGFNVCTLANNHILDQGEDNCLITKELLEKNDIKTVGVGKNADDAGKVLYIKIQQEILAVINCCEHEFSIAGNNCGGANAINPIKQWYAISEARLKADYVLVIAHGGHEMYNLPSPRMKELFHFYIDAGADAVVNHHQHCYSGYEYYNEKPIFYGLGNFCFDWNGKRNSLWNKGILVEIEFSNYKNTTHKIIPFIQGDNEPSVNILSNRYNSPQFLDNLQNC